MSSRKSNKVDGIIEKINHAWFVRYTDVKGVTARLPVSDVEAWNSDIEINLPVVIKLQAGGCKILSRKGNKRFVRSG